MAVPSDQQLAALASDVARRLLASNAQLVTAESCTGGWIAKLCTDIPGSSQWFDCGFVCYSDEAKARDLGVSPKLIDEDGAVSESVVRALAEGALARTKAVVASSISGIAGPEGGSAQKPVGTVWFALARRVESAVECQGHLIQFDGDRDAVRRQAVEYALGLVRALEFAPPP